MRRPRRRDDQEQNGAILTAFPSFRRIKRGNPYVWEGSLRPTDLSREYRLRITHHHGCRPLVEVLAPELEPGPDGTRVPHTFRAGAICLHVIEEWSESLFIHETVLPWASLWLYFYETWQATGRWEGGGHEPKASAEAEATAEDAAGR